MHRSLSLRPLFASMLCAWLIVGPAAGQTQSTEKKGAAEKPDKSERGGDGDRCLMIAAENLAKGSGNFFLYIQLSDKHYTIEKGDHLEYDILLPALNPVPKGGVDADLSEKNLPAAANRPWLRDCGIEDQNKITAHGDGILEPAKDKWYHRVLDISKLAGATTARWNIVFEGDVTGQYVQFLDNIRVTRDGKTVLSLYENEKAPELKLRQREGYSQNVIMDAVPRSDSMNEAKVGEVLAKARKSNEMRAARDEFHAEIEVARDLAKQLKDDKLAAEVDAAAKDENSAAFDAGDTEAYMESVHQVRHRLGHAHPQMQKFTGHLVGHAHIDLQWLWSWDETVNQIIPETFGQAVKFMREFPDFTFSQSSATLYEVTEKHHPELFKDIQEFVKKGQWELVGGRWCEGDNNMISPESHVRHLLYGQRYFQKKFGKMCTVGWEPDTFGHCWTMPQILKKGGIEYYYFCRAGKNVPLFWWEGPDGSKVLAFEEPATGGWYNDVVSDEKVRELAKFTGTTGSMDHLMVYGVGNHGGGPTREYIQAAIEMKKRGVWPNIKFSTASEFFARLSRQADQLHIQTIKDELNPVFEGCYTTHGRIKKYNRDSEALLESAEVWAALASSGSLPYPREDFESMWRDVCWNHHHDTLPGSFVHSSAEYSYKMYDALIERATGILTRSQRRLISQMPSASDELQLVVFNPLAWTRNEVVEATVRVPAAQRLTTLFDGEGDVATSVIERRIDGNDVVMKICFAARNVPGCGFKVFRNRGPASKSPEPVTAQNIDKIWPAGPDPAAALNAKVDSPARLQILHEKPHGMTAWVVGQFDKTTDLAPAGPPEVIESNALRTRVRQKYQFGKSTITQDTIRYADRPRIDFETTVDWQEVGNSKDGCNMLKVAFDTGIKAESAVYEIPFGDISRKNDGHEDVALRWVAISGEGGPADGQIDPGTQKQLEGLGYLGNRGTGRTVAVLNDCKHAYDVKDGVIRLTLLRSSYDPDPRPDVGVHHIRYSLFTGAGPMDKATLVRAACQFNKPLSAVVRGGPQGSEANARDAAKPESGRTQLAGDQIAANASSGWSGLSVVPSNVIVTSVKLAEDNDDVIVRAYECVGKTAAAKFKLGFPATSAAENDFLEREMKDARPASVAGGVLSADFKPYEIRTFRLRR